MAACPTYNKHWECKIHPNYLFLVLLSCAMGSSRKYHTAPTEGTGISWGVEGSVRPKNLKKCMKLNWNFQRGGGIPTEEVWIFSGITRCHDTGNN